MNAQPPAADDLGVDVSDDVSDDVSVDMSDAVSEDEAAPPGAAARSRRKRPSAWLILGGLAVLALAGWISAVTVDRDSGIDLLALARQTASDIGRLRWQFTVIVIALAGLHYLATAIAARAASGLALPLRETLVVQLAAAAANRLTPAGLGGAALNARYFTRRGLDAPAAVGAVAVLAVVGGLSDLVVLTLIVLIGSSLGLSGSTEEFVLLARHVTGLLGPARSPWLWIGVVCLALVILAVFLSRHRFARNLRWSNIAKPVRRLLHHPRDLATLIVASGATTVILGFAFVATIAMVPEQEPSASVVAVLVAFLIGSAAGSAVPIPAGLGSSEAAYVAVLTSLHVPTSHAIEEVLLFRIITFWAPAAIGVLATRRLYKSKAL